MRKDERQSSRSAIPRRPVFNEKLLEEDIASGRATKTVNKRGNETIEFKTTRLTKRDLEKKISSFKDNICIETLRMLHRVVRYRMLFGTEEVKRFFEFRVAEDIIKLVSLNDWILDDSFVKETIFSWLKEKKVKYLEALVKALGGPPKDVSWCLPHVLAQAVYFTYKESFNYAHGETVQKMAQLFDLKETAIERAIFLPIDDFVSPYSRRRTFAGIPDTKVYELVKDKMSSGMKLTPAIKEMSDETGIPRNTLTKQWYRAKDFRNKEKGAADRGLKDQRDEKREQNGEEKKRIKRMVNRIDKDIKQIERRKSQPMEAEERRRLEIHKVNLKRRQMKLLSKSDDL
ncbi:MAG: hypothetical protein WBF13_09715 [Candidatus Zixiibacteriota bacterium]